MPRDHTINVYHEIDITHLDAARIIAWCDSCLEGGWNVVADSGGRHCRGDGGHVAILLCERFTDAVMFRLAWDK